MIVEWVGQLFRVWGRARRDEPGGYLEHVGEELVRLGERRRQLPATSR
jgi:hypothetical protein